MEEAAQDICARDASNANLESSYTLRREEVKDSIRNVYDKIGTPIDFGEIAFVTVINAMLNMLWGGTLQGEEGAKFKKLIAEQMVLFGKPSVSDLFPVLARFDLQGIERQSQKFFNGLRTFLILQLKSG